MATGGTETGLLQTLKQRFPEIPEGVVCNTMYQNRNNLDRCIAVLERESPKYMYGEYQSAVTMMPVDPMQNLHLQDSRPSSVSSTSSQNEERRLSNSSIASAPGALMQGGSTQDFRGSSEHMTEPQSAPVVAPSYQPFEQGFQNSPPQYTSTYLTNVASHHQHQQQQQQQQPPQQQQHTSHYTHSPVHTPYNRSPSGSFTTPTSTTTPPPYYHSSQQHYVSGVSTRNAPYSGHGTPTKHYSSSGTASPVLHPPQHYSSSSNRTLSQHHYGGGTGTAQQYVPAAAATGYEQQHYSSHAATPQQQQYTSTAAHQYPSPGVAGHQQYATPGAAAGQQQYGSGVGVASGHQQYTSPAGSHPQHQQQFTSPGTGHYVNYSPSNQTQYSSSATASPSHSHHQQKPYSATSLHYYPINQQSGPTHSSSSTNTHNVTFQLASPSPPTPPPLPPPPLSNQTGSSDSSNRVTSTYRFTPTQPKIVQILGGITARENEDILNRSIDGTATPPPPIQPLSPASSHSSLLESPLDEPYLHHPTPTPSPAAASGLTKEQEDYAYTQALLLHQKARCDRLLRDLEDEKLKLDKSRRQVEQMERELVERRDRSSQLPNAEHIGRLRRENISLQTDIQIMSREVQLINSGQVQTAEQTSSFYGNIGSTGAPGPVPPKPPDYSPSSKAQQLPKPQPRPASQEVIGVMATQPAGVLEPDENQQWSCVHCTFLNHPALDKCECCEMPRVI